MTTMTESHRVRQINALLGERYRNKVSGRHYRVTREAAGLCTLEGIDRRVIDVAREILIDPNSAWERVT